MLRQAATYSRWLVPSSRAGFWTFTDAYQLFTLQDKSHVEVYAIDPRTVLRPEGLQTVDLASEAVLLRLPASLVPKLAEGVSELADMDEPGNNWYFGERSEIFDYKLVGEINTQSGFAAFIYRGLLEREMEKGDLAERMPSWEKFLELTSDHVDWPHRKFPFLWAGRVVEANQAAVYTLERQGRMTGVLLSSESSGGGRED